MSSSHRAWPGVPRAARVATGAALVIALSFLFAVQGCGGDDGPSEPTGLSVVLGSRRVQITREVAVEAVSTYDSARSDLPACDWYVDGVPGGNAMLGTITQSNPGVYTAPPAVPAGGAVEIRAVSRSDSGIEAADTLSVVFTVRYVDAGSGSDTASGGSWTNPLRTLTYALDAVADGDTLVVLPGSYDPDHGEGASYFIPGGVTVTGSHRDSCLVYGSGSEFCVVRLGDGATLESLTVGNWDADDIAVLSTGGGYIRDVAIREPFGYAGIRADGGRAGRLNDVTIEGCELVNSDAPLSGRALEFYYGTHCTLRGCSVRGWQDGVYINRDSDPLIESCTIADNVLGVFAAGGGGLLTIPDLGGGARGSAGGNTIRDNASVGVWNLTAATIWALDNSWTNDPPTEGDEFPTDLLNSGGGSIVWTR